MFNTKIGPKKGFNNMNIMRHLSLSKVRSNCKLLLHQTKSVIQSNVSIIRNFKNTPNVCIKMFLETENKYAYNIMQNNGYGAKINIDKEDMQIITKEDFSKILNTDWYKENPKKIFRMLAVLGVYCKENDICISNKQFDSFIDSLTDNIKFASDEELKTLFLSLQKWPQTESIRTRNFIEVWAALDDECINRILRWTFDEMLSFLSLFYMINVVRYSDFCKKCLNKLATKSKRLTKAQVVQCMFFIGTARKTPIDVHSLEVHIEEIFPKFNIDELAIIAMGLFKSNTPIRSMTLVCNIIDKIIENSKNIHEVSLAALLKIIRYSMKIPIDNKIFDLLESLQHECERLSIMCNVHLALVGTSTLTLHENCLNKIAKRVIKSMPESRLKDLERLVLTYGTLNFKPDTEECFFDKVLDELKRPERDEEIKIHGRSLSCCVAFLTLLEIYPVDLISKCLSQDFLLATYGKYFYQYGREILTIHNVAKLFIKDDINMLNDKQAIALAKKYTDYIPSETYQKQYNISERLFLDVKKVLQESRGGKEYVTGFHVIPHHQRGDIVICNDKQGAPVPVEDAFYGKQFGLLHKPSSDNVWIALVIAGRHSLIYNSHEPTGAYKTKIKELNTLGYYANIVKLSIYNNLKTDEQKLEYLNKLIEEALNNK